MPPTPNRRKGSHLTASNAPTVHEGIPISLSLTIGGPPCPGIDCNQIKILKENELASAISLINKGNPPKEVLEKFSNTLAKKFSHLPFELLKKIDNQELDRFTKFSFKRRK